MTEQIHWVIEVTILPGQLENFRAVARDLTAHAKTEPGTLMYEWYFNDDNTVCHVVERYRDSAALQTHGESFGAYAGRFMQACKPGRFEVYGPISAEAKTDLASLHPTY